jgi:CubicO group peptidase (beta-lactamase class C family)
MWHSGGTEGSESTWLVDPSRDLVVTVLTQRMFSSPTPPPIHDELRAAAYAALT